MANMNEHEFDQMIDDAAHEVDDIFATHKLMMPEEERFALSDYLTALARKLDNQPLTANRLSTILQSYDNATEVVINGYPITAVITLPDGRVQLETAE